MSCISRIRGSKYLRRVVRRCSKCCATSVTALNFEEFEDALREEVLLTLGAR